MIVDARRGVGRGAQWSGFGDKIRKENKMMSQSTAATKLVLIQLILILLLPPRFQLVGIHWLVIY
jgi:hypothetical protein